MAVNNNFYKYIFAVVVTLIFLGPIYGMIKPVSLDELVDRSDVIAVVNVLAVKNVGTLPSGNEVIANLVSINQPLMGNVAVGERLKLKTFSMEDNAVLKPKTRVLLFLRRVKDYYEITSGIAGAWPINDNDVISGYGSGKTIDDVEKSISRKNDSENGKKEPKKPAKTVLSI